MARKKSPGCGTVIIGLIALAMAAKYWYVLVAIGFATLAIWGVVKLTRSWSTPEAPDKNTLINQQLQHNSGLLGKTLDRNNANSKADQVNAEIEKDLATARAAAEVAIKQQAVEKAAIRERVARVNSEIEQILATEKAAASVVITEKKAADVEVAANQITDTPAPIVISDPKANTLINHQLPQNSPELLEKTLDRNDANTKVEQVNAVIEKDLAKEKAAAEVSINIINRLKATLVDTEIQRVLDAKKAALQERVAQVHVEIEQILAIEKTAASAAVAAEKTAATEVSTKVSSSEENVQIINRLKAVLVNAEIQRILDAEKAVLQVRVGQTNVAIERILTTEKTVASVVVAAEKPYDEVTQKQKTTEEIEQIDNLYDVISAPFETRWILDFENMGMSKSIAQENAENQPVLENEKAAPSAVVVDTSKMQSEKCDLCKTTGLHSVLRLDPQCIGCDKNSSALKYSSIAVTTTSRKQNAKCAFCDTWGLHSILRITYYTIDFHCFACGKNFCISNVDTNVITPTATKPEITQKLKYYDFVLANEVGPLKTGDQWFEEKTQKRRVRTGSPKAYEWLLPFMPLEIARLDKVIPVLEWGPNSACIIATAIRVLIRERRRAKQPYEALLYALYSTCILTDFAESLTFDGFNIRSIASHVDIRELRNIRIDYSTMGYCYIEKLLKTDIKWLIEVFGEPETHQSFDAQWPKIRLNAISRYCWGELLEANKPSRFISREKKNMDEWLRERMRYNPPRYTELQEIALRQHSNHKEWLERKAAREAQLAASPVTVQPATSVKQRGYAIPAPPKPSHSFSLDMSSIETKLAETVAVSAILKDIFSEDVPLSPQTTVLESTTTEATIAGLDAESFSFMQALASKHIWARDELEKLANHHSLMLDGTLDSINDASYDHFGGPFFEGDDPIEINTEFAKEIAA